MRTFLRLSVFECRQSLKKPLLWIAILPITAIILINMHTYLFTDFPMTDYEEFVHQIELRKEGSGASNYAMEMYSPLTEEEAYAGTMQKYCTFCSINYKLDYDQIYRYVMDNRLSYDDDDWSALNEYLYDLVPEERKPYFVPLDKKSSHQFSVSIRLGDYEGWTAYRDSLLAKRNYTEYIGQRYADQGGVCMLFYFFAVFAATFSQEVKKESFETLHSKKIRSGKYVIAKLTGCGIAVMLIGLLPTLAVDVLAVVHCQRLDLAFSLFDVCKYYFWWIVPTLFMVQSLIAVCTFVCGSGLPIVPFLVFWTVGGTRAPVDNKGLKLSIQDFWNITVRTSNFSDVLFTVLPPEFYHGVLLHKLFQLAVILVFSALSILLYAKKNPLEKRRSR